jgi:hypothetical protein
MAITVWQKLPEMFATNRTFHLVSAIERLDQKTEDITTPDQELTRKYFGK